MKSNGTWMSIEEKKAIYVETRDMVETKAKLMEYQASCNIDEGKRGLFMAVLNGYLTINEIVDSNKGQNIVFIGLPSTVPETSNNDRNKHKRLRTIIKIIELISSHCKYKAIFLFNQHYANNLENLLYPHWLKLKLQNDDRDVNQEIISKETKNRKSMPRNERNERVEDRSEFSLIKISQAFKSIQ